MRGRIPLFVLLAVLSLPGHAQEGPESAGIPPERARGDIPPGFEPMDLPGLSRRERQRVERFNRQAEVQQDLQRREMFRTVERTGRANWTLWGDW